MEEIRMEEVIDRLSKIEAAAEGIETETEKEKEAYAKFTDQKIKEFDERLERDTENTLSELREKLEKNKREELSAMRDDIIGYTDKLEKMYEANHDKLVAKIVRDIVKE